MNLKTKTEIAKLAGKSLPAVSKALRQNRLELFKNTNQINFDSPKTQAFINTIVQGQKNIIPQVQESNVEPDPDLKKAGEKVLTAQAKKIIEEAGLKEQQRIEREIKNAVSLGQLVRVESVDSMIMVWFDAWGNTCKRRFNGSVDEFMRMAFQVFENESKGTMHDMSRAKIKRDWANSFEKWQHEGNQEAMRRLTEIQEDQAK